MQWQWQASTSDSVWRSICTSSRSVVAVAVEVVTGSRMVGVPGKRTTRMAISVPIAVFGGAAISEVAIPSYRSYHGTSGEIEEARND